MVSYFHSMNFKPTIKSIVMKKTRHLTLISTVATLIFLWLLMFQGNNPGNPSEIILKKEKDALDKWLNRSVWGYLDLFTKDATYFDNATKMKLKGFEAIKNYIAPWDGKIYAPNYMMTNVDVKVVDNLGILTYNLYNFNEKGDTTVRWNSTEIYQKVGDDWKITHSHWSLIK